MVNIKKCQDSDYEFCYKLSKENMTPYVNRHWNGWEDSFFTKNFILKRAKVIEIDDIMIGFFETEIKDNIGILHGIQIVKKYRNKGIGTKVMKIIHEEMKDKGVREIILKVFEDNPVIKLYNKLGYINMGPSGSVNTIKMKKMI